MGRHRHIRREEETDDRLDVAHMDFPIVEGKTVSLAICGHYQNRCKSGASFRVEDGPPPGWVWRESAGIVHYECPECSPKTCRHPEDNGEYAP